MADTNEVYLTSSVSFLGRPTKMRASRLLSMLLLLQAKGRVTAQALAEEFEVSVRTVYRDVDDLSAAGVPVYAERGPGGGFALLDGYRTRLTGMTAAEVETLSIAGLGGPAAELGLAERLHAAQLKLLAALPEARPEGSRIGARLHVDPIEWFRRPRPVPDLPLIADAVWEQRRIVLLYPGRLGTTEREIEPLGLVLKTGDWYLVGRSAGEVRTYKARNISQVRVLDETFARPPGFDLPAEWSKAVARFEAGLLTGTARLRLTAEGVARLLRLGAAALARASFAPVRDDGLQEVTLPIERLDTAADQLLGLAAHVEVLEPVELRTRLRELAQSVADLNAA